MELDSAEKLFWVSYNERIRSSRVIGSLGRRIARQCPALFKTIRFVYSHMDSRTADRALMNKQVRGSLSISHCGISDGGEDRRARRRVVLGRQLREEPRAAQVGAERGRSRRAVHGAQEQRLRAHRS